VGKFPAVCARDPIGGTDQGPVLSGYFACFTGVRSGGPAGTFAGTAAPVPCIKCSDIVLVQLAGPYAKVRCLAGEQQIVLRSGESADRRVCPG